MQVASGASPLHCTGLFPPGPDSSKAPSLPVFESRWLMPTSTVSLHNIFSLDYIKQKENIIRYFYVGGTFQHYLMMRWHQLETLKEPDLLSTTKSWAFQAHPMHLVCSLYTKTPLQRRAQDPQSASHSWTPASSLWECVLLRRWLS